jgi:hypothetical protein
MLGFDRNTVPKNELQCKKNRVQILTDYLGFLIGLKFE